MENRRRLPAGVQDFETIIKDGFVYIDKTHYIYDLANNFGNAIFVSRPRRFGKSLLCSTLKYYFQGRRDLFEGLAIDHLETQWKQHPVLHLSMAGVKSTEPENVRDAVSALLRRYEAVYGRDPESNTLGQRLAYLIAKAHEKTGEKTVVIIDEYDAPVLHVIGDPDKMQAVRNVFNEFYPPLKDEAEHLRFVFLTGITKFSQMSIFSTLNHLSIISMDERFEGLCGITAQELEQNFGIEIESIAHNIGCSTDDAMRLLRERYDGYHFGASLTDVYNPYSLLNAFTFCKLNDYWFGPGTPSALIQVLSNYRFELNDVEGIIAAEGDFDQPFDNFETAIPILYQSGYLTIKDYDKRLKAYTLGIPNGEVYRGLYRTLMAHYLNGNTNTNSKLLLNVKRAMLDDDIDAALTAVQAYMAALPHHLSNKTEQDFETILRVLFDGIGIEVDTEVQSAYGRCDVVMKTPRRICVMELKTDSGGTVDDALAQIDSQNYLIPYRDDPREKVKVGAMMDRATHTLREWKTVS